MIAFLDTNVKKRARQQRVIRAAAPLLARAGWDGRGVEAALLAEARDPLLDAQIRAEASVASSLAAQQTNLQNAGICLDELIRFSAAPNGLNGLDADLSKLFSSFETLSGDPANVPLRRRIVRSAEDIAAKFNRASSRLDGLKNDLNASIQEDVVRANQDLSDIAGLNRRIMESQAWGGRAGTLAGQRGQHLKSLAGRVNIIATRRADGGVNVSIGGVAMVCGAKTPDSLATYPDQNDNLRIQAQNAGTRLKPAGGSIAGKITARDGGLAGLQSGLNALASQLITRVNSIYSSGCESNSGAGRDFFTGTGASDIGVNSTVADDPSQLQAVGAAPALETFGQSYARTVTNLGGALLKVSDDLSSSRAVTQMLANERDSARGVSLGAEWTDLQRYRQACAASAQVHATLIEMLPVQ
jgi:flagellar hook-associated protein 1 FlgK